MRIGTSRSDRIGFIVFVTLASLLAVLLIAGPKGDDQVQTVSAFADLPENEQAQAPAPVATTEPVALPTAAPEPAAAVPLPAFDAPDDEGAAADDEAAAGATELEDDAQDGDAIAVDTTTEAPVSSEEPAAVPAESAPAQADTQDAGGQTAEVATEAAPVPNPQPATTAPAADATAVPNPQLPEATAVPNPQLPEATTVPNPQPATTQNVNAPAPAAVGGTFTHTLTATVARPTLYTSANGTPFTPTFNGVALPAVNPTVFGNALVYRVLAGTPDDGSGWAQVYVPARPNGTTAWVQTSQFRWGSSNRMLQINVSNNTVTVFEGSNVLLTTSAVTGKGSSRTPLANGWVEEIMAGPSSAYGPRLISLGIFSDQLNSFAGSIPKIALHGTNNPGLMGQYASNGCIRVPNDIINQIAGMLPIGSKVQIVN